MALTEIPITVEIGNLPEYREYPTVQDIVDAVQARISAYVNRDDLGLAGIQSVPVGSLISNVSQIAPSGYLPCDGRALLRADYVELFAACGTNFGAGNGTTTFNIPDLRGCVMVGAGQRSGLTNRVVGTYFGEETHTLTGAESGQLNFTINQDDGDSQGGSFGSMLQTTLNGVTLNPNINPNAINNSQAFPNNQTAHNNMQPGVVVYHYIKY